MGNLREWESIKGENCSFIWEKNIFWEINFFIVVAWGDLGLELWSCDLRPRASGMGRYMKVKYGSFIRDTKCFLKKIIRVRHTIHFYSALISLKAGFPL